MNASKLASITAACALLFACGEPAEAPWQVVARDLPGALLSVWGSSETNVYAVGSDAGDGRGPLVVRYDGASWERLDTGVTGNLWWVHGFDGGPIYMGGDGGLILRYADGQFTRMTTPGSDTVFGLWGTSPSEMWAVGGALGGARGAFAWRSNGVDAWSLAPGFPAQLATNTALWKMYGRAADDAWIVGTGGKTLRWDGSGLAEVSTGIDASLFTVHGDAERYVAVGGFGNGLILESTGATWENVSPDGAYSLVGVHLADGEAVAVGEEGAVYRRGGDGTWREQDIGVVLRETFHSVWIDPAGGVWAAGGQVSSFPLVDGVLVYGGRRQVGSFP